MPITAVDCKLCFTSTFRFGFEEPREECGDLDLRDDFFLDIPYDDPPAAADD